MPVQEYALEQMLGMNRNAAEGVTEENPVELANLVPTRAGGWQVRGLARLANSTVAYGDYGTVIGYDHQGGSSYYDNLGTVNQKAALVSVEGSPTRTQGNAIDARPTYAVHLPGAGMYARSMTNIVGDDGTSAGQTFLLKAKDTSSVVLNSPWRAVVTASTTSGGTFPAGKYRAYALSYIRTPSGKLYTDATMYYLDLTSAGAIVATVTPSGMPVYVGAEIYLARNPQATTAATMFTPTWGAVNRPLEFVLQGELTSTAPSLTITEVQFGPTLNVSGYGTPLLAQLGEDRLGGYVPVGIHNERVFFHPTPSSTGYRYRWVTDANGPRYTSNGRDWQSALDRYTALTVGWTERGTLNLYNMVKSFYTLPASNSKQITAFTSTEEGLIIWLDNEAFLMRGDPSFAEQAEFNFEDFNFRPFLSIGHDAGAPPGQLGNLIYCTWNGEVYQISGGASENISQAVYDRNDKFIQVVGDVNRNCILCRTQIGLVYAYYPDSGFWCRLYTAVQLLLPGVTETYAIIEGSSGLTYQLRPEFSPAEATGGNSGELEEPRARYRWTFGSKRRLKMLKRVRLYVSPRFAGTVRMSYSIDNLSFPTRITPYRRGDELIFALPLGVVGSQFNVTFEFSGMVAASVIEPPILADYVDVREKR